MNRVILMGRLTRDPEIRYSQNANDQLAIARFTLAVDRRFKRDGSDNTADFISCVAFRQQAEFMGKYTRQGTKLCLEGRIQTGSYVKQDGTKVYTTDVVVDNVEFAESKAAEAGRISGAPQGQWQNRNQGAWQSQGQAQPPQGQWQSQEQSPWPTQSQAQSAPSYGEQSFMNAPVPDSQDAQDDGFMAIPDAVDDEGLPFG